MPEDNQVQTTENQTVVENEGQEPQVVEPTQENVVVNNEPEVDKTKVDDVDYKAKFEEMEAELSRTIVELTKERDDLTTQLQQAQDDMQSRMSALQQELDELKQYKSQIEKDKLDAERQTVLEQFSDLQDTDEYKELVENLGDLTPKALEDKLYIIAGRIARQNRKTQKQQIKPKLNIATPTSNEEVPNFKFANFLMK